ncbi:uncharacterized protein [Littorina saxatilis]|uniref:uncharacterized protein n=1 Tax=Littorina saxatilis TaxID=31220 RepID=UPI0038B4F352
MNRRSPQSPAGSVSSCSSPAPLSASWNPRDRTSHSPTNSYNHDNYVEQVDDDLFGSAAWRKKRGKRGGKVGQENSDCHDGNAAAGRLSFFTDVRQWAGVKLVEQRVYELSDHVSAVKNWITIMFKRNFTSKVNISSNGQNGVAVPSANGSPTTTIMTGSYDLTDEVLVQQARLVVGSYIYHRLSGKGLMTKRVEVSPYHSVLAEEVFCAGQELERLYPRTYTDVSRRICMTMTSAQLVRRALTAVLEGTFRSGATWAKVVSMVVMASAFAEECVIQGHPSFAQDVVMCVGHFVSLNLTGWLARQGGWNAFPTTRPNVIEKAPSSSPLLFISLVVAGVSFIVFFLSRMILDVT